MVLGANSNTGRFWETRHLFNWLSDRRPPTSSRKDHAVSVSAPGFTLISLLNGGRVQRQRGDRIDRRHDRA